MKLRQGFVSNSSSTSFVLSEGDFPSVLELAKEIVGIMLEGVKFQLALDVRCNRNPEGSVGDVRQLEMYLAQLQRLAAAGGNADAPIRVPWEWPVEIVKRSGCYEVDAPSGFDICPEINRRNGTSCHENFMLGFAGWPKFAEFRVLEELDASPDEVEGESK